MFKKKSKIIFECEDVEGGVTIKVKTKGKIYDRYIYSIKQLIDSKIKQANGKNKRK